MAGLAAQSIENRIRIELSTMAKDKTEKKAKAEKSAPAGSFAKPSESTGGGSGWKMTDEAEGRLLLITPLKESTVETTDYGTKDIIVADVVVINEKKPEKSEEQKDVFIFGGYLRGDLKEFIGKRMFLARLGKGDKKEKGNFPWKFIDPTAEEIALAEAYIASIDPFATGAEKKSKKDKS